MQAGSYREIPLRRRDGSIAASTLVDNDDYADVDHWRWCLASNGYVRRNTKVMDETGRKRQVEVSLHRYLLGLQPGDLLEADHINGDRLDNRRTNLRVVTRAQNQQNVSYGRARSQHRGVFWDARQGRWRAQLRLARRARFLGHYDTEAEAAEVAAAFIATHVPYAAR